MKSALLTFVFVESLVKMLENQPRCLPSRLSCLPSICFHPRQVIRRDLTDDRERERKKQWCASVRRRHGLLCAYPTHFKAMLGRQQPRFGVSIACRRNDALYDVAQSHIAQMIASKFYTHTHTQRERGKVSDATAKAHATAIPSIDMVGAGRVASGPVESEALDRERAVGRPKGSG